MTADEYDVIDGQLGRAIRTWADAVQPLHDGVKLDVQGPLPAPGMDPTWIVRVTAPWRDAELLLFRGPHPEVSWFDPCETEPAPHLEGHDDLTAEALTGLLRRLLSPSVG